MIIQPKSKLPWKEKLINNKYKILDTEGSVVIDDVEDLATALYIQDACNNFNEAVDLLRELAALPESRVYNFLNKIDNG